MDIEFALLTGLMFACFVAALFAPSKYRKRLAATFGLAFATSMPFAIFAIRRITREENVPVPVLTVTIFLLLPSSLGIAGCLIRWFTLDIIRMLKDLFGKPEAAS